MIIIHCARACAHLASPPELLTAGMAKAVTVEFEFTEDWDGLTKTAVFTNGKTTVDVLQSRWQGNTVTVPAEVLTTAGRYVRVGVYGSNADGVALPTIWADLGKVRPGAEPSGDASTDPSLPVWAQLQELIGDLDDLTTKAKDNLVAAINEAAKTGSGGGSIDLRVADGYIQYSNDGGTTWENLIAIADLKGDDGAPGTPGTDGKDGAPGQDGYSPSASVSKTDTGATITITDKTGTTTAEIKNGKDGTNGKDGSPGAKGDTGATPNIQIGTVETLPAGSDATASMGGTAENPLLNLGIPKGPSGSGGSSTITTETETDIAGLLMGDSGKVRKAIPGTDYLTESDLYICTVTASGTSYTSDKTPTELFAASKAGKIVVARYKNAVYFFAGGNGQVAQFSRVLSSTVHILRIMPTGAASLYTVNLQESALVTDLEANKTSNTSYLSAKAVYDAIPHPEAKSDAQTQPVGVDADGKLWTQPGGGASGGTDISLGVTGAAVGQIVKITEVDANGKPTAWAKLNRDWTVKETYPLKDMTFPAAISIPQDSDSMLAITGTDITADKNTNINLTLSTASAEGGYGSRWSFTTKLYGHSWGSGVCMMLLRKRTGTNAFTMRRIGWAGGYTPIAWPESMQNGENGRLYYIINVDDVTLLNPDTNTNVILYTRDALC